jgi:hypothetical protein
MRAVFGARRRLRPLQMSRRCSKTNDVDEAGHELRLLSGCSLAVTLAVVSTAGYPRVDPSRPHWMGCQGSDGGSSVTLAGTIISIVPIPLANRVIIEFHAVNDMVTEPDTYIGVRLYVARHWGCDPTDIELWHWAKVVREIGFIARSPLNPGPAEALAAARESQIDSICFSFCRTYAHKPAFMRNRSSGDKHANDRRH